MAVSPDAATVSAALVGLKLAPGPDTHANAETSNGSAKPGQSSSSSQPVETKKYARGENPKLRYKKPYWWPYRTFVKKRWIGRELLEVISTEFRDRSVEYYKHALESGVTRVNGVTAWPGLILRDGDRLDNTVHRHEPPITNDPILVLHIDRQREFIVISKPGSMPVHATGRYFRHTVLEVMESDYGIKCYAVNRLDRLTSGLMIMGLSGPASRDLAEEFASGTVKKQYVARVKGRFPDGEVEVDQPLISVDRQMGLVIVAPEGKPATTIFKRMSYDAERDQSVVHCRPQTGRTHQLRVHLQWLGYPIANDPLYSLENVWGSELGQGGVELAEQDAESSQAAMIAKRVATPLSEGSRVSTPNPSAGNVGQYANGQPKVLNSDSVTERDMANIDVSSPIRLSQQAKDIICKLRKMKDEAEDWVKWNEVVFATKEAQDSLDPTTPSASTSSTTAAPPTQPTEKDIHVPHARAVQAERKAAGRQALPEPLPEDTVSPLKRPAHIPEGFCTQCFVPLPDDPDPETLFIYLHAWKYETNGLGQWETPLPRWASDEWDGDWRGWAHGAEVKQAVERIGFGDAAQTTRTSAAATEGQTTGA